MDGILLLDKPSDMTSHDAVNIVRRIYKTKQVGHTGTLDPMATGLLTVLVGRAVKASEFLVDHDKKYLATLLLGKTSDTEDVFGNLTDTGIPLPSENEVKAVASGFVGEIMQIPPMYSALKVGGKKLANLARKGITVDREARPVSVYSLEIETLDEKAGRYLLSVSCSKGTYIRTLCADIGQRLGCGGVMESLRRVESGGFSLSDAKTLEQLSEYDEKALEKALLPTEMLFSACGKLLLSYYPAHLAKNGAELYPEKNREDFIASGIDPASLTVGTRLRLYDRDGFFAIGDVTEFEEGLAVKPVKLFRLEK